MTDLLDDALQSLLVLARSGDVNAFEEFYDRTVSWLLPHMRRACGNEDVEQAIGDLYIQAWSTIQGFVPGESPKGWLLRIAFANASNSKTKSAPGSTRPVERASSNGDEASRPKKNGPAVQAKQSDANALVELLAHDIRMSLSTAKDALRAMARESLPMDGATGQALGRSLHDIERFVEAALEETREIPKTLHQPHSAEKQVER